jgi:hypothetical protein
MPYRSFRDALLRDFCVRNNLKQIIRDYDNRDPLDALKDAELLAELQSQRCKELGIA